MNTKLTVPDVLKMKAEGKKITMMTAYDYSTGMLVEKAGMHTILVGDSLGMTVLGYESTVPVTLDEMIYHTKAVRRGAGNTFLISDMPFGTYNTSTECAIINATRFLKEGAADAVKVEGGERIARLVEALVKAGIPVLGHIGLTPQTVTQLGGYKVQGRTETAAKGLLEDAKALDSAGAFGIVLECIPTGLAAQITESVTVPTIGIGAGSHCDGQVLVYNDVMGVFDKFTPKFVKKYADIGDMAVRALKEFKHEVEQGVFPDEEHSFK